MPGIILQANALEISNKGGGFPTKTVMEKEKSVLGISKNYHRHYQSRGRVKGSDYVIFDCPGCKKRNRRVVYDSKAQTADGRLSFKCHGCYREIEVQRPMSKIEGIGSIVGAFDHLNEAKTHGRHAGVLVGPDGKPLM